MRGCLIWVLVYLSSSELATVFCLFQVKWMCTIEAHLSTCSLTPARPKLSFYSPLMWPWLPQPTNLVALTSGSNTLNHHPLLHITYSCICHCYIKLGSQKCNLWPRMTLHKTCENKITRECAPNTVFISTPECQQNRPSMIMLSAVEVLW